MEIVFLDTAALGEWLDFERLRIFWNLKTYEKTSPSQLIPRINKTNLLVTTKVKIWKKEIDACDNLKAIFVVATWMNNIDVSYAKEKNIPVYNVKNYSTESVVQLTFAYIFHLTVDLSAHDYFVKSGQYATSWLPSRACCTHSELSGKTIGIVGLGNIWRRIASVAKAMGMKVIYYSTTGLNDSTDYERGSFEELLEKSDIISVNAPLSPVTENMFNEFAFDKIKRNPILIVTSRWWIINEMSLLKALESGRITGAALDVYEEEPIKMTNPLLSYRARNLILTPHIGWASRESKMRLVEWLCANMEEYLSQHS